jgi:CHAD domain-containing protein
MRRRVCFEAGGKTSGALGAHLRRFGYQTLGSEKVALEVTYYDTQDGRLFKRGARLSFRSEVAGARGGWLFEREGAIFECARASGVSPVKTAVPAGELLAKNIETLTAGKTVFPVLRARVAGERFGIAAPVGVFAELSNQRWVFYPPFTGGFEDTNGSKPLEFVELAVPSTSKRCPEPDEPNTAEFSYLSILLRDFMGLPHVEPDPMILGLGFLDRPLPGAPVPSKYAVSGDDPLPDAVCKVLGAQSYKMQANTEGVLLDLDPEFLHDLRVATRRSRFALKYARLFAERGVCDALREELAWVSGSLGPVRDIDVLLEGLEERLERAGVPADAKELTRGLLAGRRARVFVELKKTLESERCRAAVRTLSSFQSRALATEGALSATTTETSATPAVREAAPGLVEKTLKRVKKTAKGHSEGARPPGFDRAADFTPAALHELRIAFKGLRYTCEFFLPFFGDEMREAVKTIVVFQDCLGRYQDAMTAAELLEELFREALSGAPSMKPETLLAFGALVQTYRDAGFMEQKRFSELWRSFKALDRKMRRLASHR